MNTTNLYVEPLLVGGMVGATVLLPFHPELAKFITNGTTTLEHKLVAGTTLMVIAYITGIAADRLLDSLLEPIDTHFRLWFALKSKDRKAKAAKKCDLFPEDHYRTIIMMKDSKSAVEWLHYIRTRMRLTRAFAFVLPGLSFAIPVAYLRKSNSDVDNAILLCSVVPTMWLLMAVMAVVLPRIERRWPDSSGRALRWKPPRTDDFEGLGCYARARNINLKANYRKNEPWSGMFCDILLQSFTLGALVLFAGMALAACPIGLGLLGLYMTAIGMLLTLAVGFGWRRLAKTYMTYLRLLGEAYDNAEPSPKK